MQETKKKIVIIGAGPAGITAAYEILKGSSDYEVMILEETDKIGGISQTVTYHDHKIDLGGHRFYSKNKKINEWWSKILPLEQSYIDDSKEKVRKDEDKVLLIRHRVSRIYYNHRFFAYPVQMNKRTLHNLGALTTVKVGFSYIKAVLFKRKENSLEDFYINRFGKQLYQMFFEGYTEKLWGKPSAQLSCDWGAQRVRGLSIKNMVYHMLKKGKEDATPTSLIESFQYPKLGPGQLWEEAACQIEKMGGMIKKQCKVVQIAHDKNCIHSVTCKTDSGMEEITGDLFLSSMPLKDLITAMESVPNPVQEIAKNLPYRAFVTIGILLNKFEVEKYSQKHKKVNVGGDSHKRLNDCWIYVQDTGVKLGRIQIYNNWSAYLVKDPENTVWIGAEYFCNEGDTFYQMSEKEWLSQAIQDLTKIGLVQEDTKVLDYHGERIAKAYPAYYGSYQDIAKLRQYVDSYDNLYAIGRNGQHRYNNMDHSMLTAMKAVDDILQKRHQKAEIWNVNVEEEYLEE